MRERIVGELGDLAHPRFLVYLMGPYRAFDVEAVLERADANPDGHDGPALPESANFGALVDADAELDGDDAVLDLLLEVRDALRTGPGVNAFLAVDVDVPLAEVDAATQSVEFALASNVVAYVVPEIGANLGVGIEVGAVLEAIYRGAEDGPADASRAGHAERVVFAHESTVRSSMIAAVSDRWEARVYAYDDREDLIEQLRLFVRDVARREVTGDLPTLDDADE